MEKEKTTKHTLTQIAKENAHLLKWQKGILTYAITVMDSPAADVAEYTTYSFDIDTNNREDVGEGEFRRVEKGIMLLRWLNKAIKDETCRIITQIQTINAG